MPKRKSTLSFLVALPVLALAGFLLYRFAGIFLPLPWLLLFVVLLGFTCVLVLFHHTFMRKSDNELLIDQGLCPHCQNDLSNIGAGQTTCPSCGEAVPAALRKWGS